MQREIRVLGKDYVQDVTMPLVAGDFNAYVITMPVSDSDNVTGFLVTAQKPDGVIITDSGTVEGNMCRYTLKTNIYDVPGDVTVRVSPMSNDTKLTVCELRFMAIPEFGGAQSVPEDRLPALTAAITYAQNMGDYAAAQAAKLENMENTRINGSVIVTDGNSTYTGSETKVGQLNGTGSIKVRDNSQDGNYIEFSATPGGEADTPTLSIRRGNTAEYFDTGKIYTSYDKPPVDSELSATSTNPVQNKVVKAELDGKMDKVPKSVTVEDPDSFVTVKIIPGEIERYGEARFIAKDKTSDSYMAIIMDPHIGMPLSFEQKIALKEMESGVIYTSLNPQTTMCGFSFASMTQEEYEALAEKDENTIYLVV